MFLLPTFLAFCIISFVESRVVMIQDAPITAEGISLRISLKEDLDSFGRKVATIKLLMDDEVAPPPPPPPPKYTPHLLGELIPDVETRFGIRNGKCPSGTVRRGPLCAPR